MRIDENAQREYRIIILAGPGLNPEALQHLRGEKW